MALPKRKTSTGRKGRRRISKKLYLPTLTKCPQCGELKKPHLACPSCNQYGYENSKGSPPSDS